MDFANEPAPLTPPALVEAEARLAEDEQDWLSLTDAAFDALMQEGEQGLAFGGL